jgi:hypothetical protein
MTDSTLLVFGCAVSFIALAGAYVYLRVSFERGPREPARSEAPGAERMAPPKPTRLGAAS